MRPPGRLFVAAVTLALHGAPRVCVAEGLDSLRAIVDGNRLYLEFAIPVQSLRAARMEVALEEHRLTVDCVVSAEVRTRERFLPRTVVREVLRRTLSFSRWYEEYVLAENGREILTHKSYYPALDRFRRFSRLHVVDLGILDPGQEYSIRLEISLVPRLPRGDPGGKDLSLAGVSVPKDMVDLLRGRGSLLSFRLESPFFRGSALPERLFSFEEARAEATVYQ